MHSALKAETKRDVAMVGSKAGLAAEKKKSAATAPATKSKSSRGAAISKDPYVGAIVIDAVSGKVLFEDNADSKGYPASMLKLMDMLIILEKLQQGQLTLQDQVPVSASARSTE